MKLLLLFFEILVLLVFCSLLSSAVFPVGHAELSPIDGSLAAGFSGLMFMVLAGGSTFIVGATFAIVLVRRFLQRKLSHPKIFFRVLLVLLSLPVIWSVISAVYNYRICPNLFYLS
jgi:hypothetical protein